MIAPIEFSNGSFLFIDLQPLNQSIELLIRLNSPAYELPQGEALAKFSKNFLPFPALNYINELPIRFFNVHIADGTRSVTEIARICKKKYQVLDILFELKDYHI